MNNSGKETRPDHSNLLNLTTLQMSKKSGGILIAKLEFLRMALSIIKATNSKQMGVKRGVKKSREIQQNWLLLKGTDEHFFTTGLSLFPCF